MKNNLDDKINKIISFLQQKISSYKAPPASGNLLNYDFCIVEDIMRFYGLEKDNNQNLLFMDAVWDLARRGIIRPSPKLGMSDQSHFSSNRFSITEQGMKWLQEAEPPFLFVTSSGYQNILMPFKERLGESFFTWGSEAANCYQYNLYIATCAMSGTSGEAILRQLLFTKCGDVVVSKIFKENNSKNKTIDALAENDNVIKNRLKSFTDKLSIWRNDSVHGENPYFEEFHAYESLTSLLGLAKYSFDNFEKITKK